MNLLKLYDVQPWRVAKWIRLRWIHGSTYLSHHGTGLPRFQGWLVLTHRLIMPDLRSKPWKDLILLLFFLY